MAYWKLVDGMYMTIECSNCGYIAGALSDIDLTVCPNCHNTMGEKE